MGSPAPGASTAVSSEYSEGSDRPALVSFAWQNSPGDGKLAPGASLQWTTTVVPEDSEVEVLLDTPRGPQSLCVHAVNECWLPAELQETTTYSWWIRAHTDLGIVRSQSFTFETPETGIHIQASAPAQLEPHGGLEWATSGTPPLSTVAILRPQSDEAAHVCAGSVPCSTGSPLVPGESYEVEVRAYDERGLYATTSLGLIQVNRPPAPPYPAFPPTGGEHRAGTVPLRWSAAEDPEGDDVRYSVELSRSGVWTLVDVGSATEHAIDVGAAESILWRVIAKDSAGNKVTSPFASLRAPDAAPSALLTSPIQDMRLPPKAPVTFSWLAQAEGSHRAYWRAPGQDWQEACSGFDGCTAALPLAAGTTYEWKVDSDAGYHGTATSSPAQFQTVEPVVLIHGLLSDGGTWGSDGGRLSLAGYEVVDFYPDLGTQPITYRPPSDTAGVSTTAANVRQQLDSQLRQLGYSADTEIIIVGHSLGGLIGRSISSQPSEYPTKELITIGTPHLGSTTGAIADAAIPRLLKPACSWILSIFIPYSGVACTVVTSLVEDLIKGSWDAVIRDLAPSSAFLNTLNSQQSELRWRAIAGDSDMLVSVASATFQSDASRMVPGGHTSLTRGAAGIQVVEEWLRSPLEPPVQSP